MVSDSTNSNPDKVETSHLFISLYSM